jgi:uncharacterized protein YggU (UPF0235/DUF167 family)
VRESAVEIKKGLGARKKTVLLRGVRREDAERIIGSL